MAKRIGVILGGKSAEREISLRSGKAVAAALTKCGYQVVELDPAADDFLALLADAHIEAAFLALHGRYGEDGTIQGMLELLGIPYTGSGVLASALAINKIMTKRMLSLAGIPTAPYITVDKFSYLQNPEAVLAELERQISAELSYPVVVKAPTQGSSIGIYFAADSRELAAAITSCFAYDDTVLIEKKINGMEVTAPLWDFYGRPETIALIEIVAEIGNYYDYASKYQPGGSTHIIPPPLSAELQQLVSLTAEQSYQVLNCRGIARVDFLVDAENKQPYVLEINTIPGMTATSLVPDAARSRGIDFEQLCELMIKSVLDQAGE